MHSCGSRIALDTFKLIVHFVEGDDLHHLRLICRDFCEAVDAMRPPFVLSNKARITGSEFSAFENFLRTQLS